MTENNDSPIYMAIATLITTQLLQILNISQSMYGPIYAGIEHFIRTCDYAKVHYEYFLRYETVIFIILIYLIYSNYTNIKNIYNRWRKNPDTFITLEIYNDADIQVFNSYTTYFPQFYELPSHVVYGDPNLLIASREYIRNLDIEDMSYYKKSGDGIRINFTDKNFNITGFYMWNKTQIYIEKDKDNGRRLIELPYITLSIEKTKNADINKYFEDISKKCDEMSNNEQKIYHIKILKNNNDIIDNDFMIYSGKKRESQKLKELYIDSFFHKDKSKLWKIIEEIHYKPETFYTFGQTPHIGLLLYGPPGTGKSTFAFRVAMALNRHIISIDLRSIKNKHEIYQIMRRPLVKGYRYQPKDVVFIFDEFDLTVFELDAKKKKMSSAYNSWINHIASLETKTIKESKESKETKLVNKIVEADVADPLGLEMVDEIDDSDDKPKKDYTMEYHGYDTQDLSIEDLLEIFQGPVPLEGAIIFATTNKYEEIRKLCPALFRTGRLTPVSFLNADNIMLKDLCNYFFGKYTDIDISNKEIMPAQLIELAAESKLLAPNNPYQYFLDKVNKFT